MKVGDLVKHPTISGVGLIIETPETTGVGCYLVEFQQTHGRIKVYVGDKKLNLLGSKKDYCPNYPCYCGACEKDILGKVK